MTTSSRPLTREQVHQVLWKLAAKFCDKNAGELTPQSKLSHDLGADSLDLVEFSMAVEEELGITLPEELFVNRDVTLGEVEQAILARMPE